MQRAAARYLRFSGIGRLLPLRAKRLGAQLRLAETNTEETVILVRMVGANINFSWGRPFPLHPRRSPDPHLALGQRDWSRKNSTLPVTITTAFSVSPLPGCCLRRSQCPGHRP